MRTKRIYSECEANKGYCAGRENTERYEYECPCGKGRIIEEHDNIPGFREHDVYIACDECSKKYTLDTSNGLRNWELYPKAEE